MNSTPYYQGQSPSPQQQQPGQQNTQPSSATPNAPYPGVGVGFPQYPQQPFNPQQQQFAQWAYQQMMFQQQQLAFQPHGPQQQQSPQFMTPQQQQQALQLQLLQQQQQQFLMQQQAQQQHAFPQPPQPPYARENNGSRTSLGSSNGSVKAGQDRRQRTTSNKSTPSSGHPQPSRTRTNSGAGGRTSPGPGLPGHRHRLSSTGSHTSSSAAPPVVTPATTRATSSSSTSTKSNGTASPSPTSTPSPPSNAGPRQPMRQASKPSPLSQGAPTATPKAPPAKPAAPAAVPGAPEPAPTAAMIKSGGLKGRLRRALSFSALDEAGHDDSKQASRKKVVNAKLASEGQIPASRSSPRPSVDSSANLATTPTASSSSLTAPPPVAYVPTEGSVRSIETAQAPKKSRSLFNAKFNRSTDNMSLSSTVSSASVMIRKLGSVGKLVRRNSLMGISNMFKDKKNKEKADSDGEGAKADAAKDKKGKKKSTAKGGKAEPSVSHATAEIEPSGSNDGLTQEELVGLSPAAKLARQHTLRSRAAEAARAKEAAEQSETPTTWEKNTATRAAAGGSTPRKTVSELGTETGWTGSDDDLSEDDGTYDGHAQRQPPQISDWRNQESPEDSDEDSTDYGTPYGEDDTVRMDSGEYDPADEPWAVGIRRSVERTRTPAKGILKNAGSYDQSHFLDGPPQAPFARVRSNSNDSAPPMGAEPGPLARIPSPDPDHIDGLHRSNSGSDRHSHHSRKLSTSSTGSASGGMLPALNFDSDMDTSGLASTLGAMAISGGKERPTSGSSFAYNNPELNASAPALSTITPSGSSSTHAPTLGLRSATVPLTKSSKKLTFAANLSVYHTFSSGAYDRRSEPATCNRLTPALAQRIKEELNSYKMEEMEVHQASRAHTHFFV